MDWIVCASSSCVVGFLFEASGVFGVPYVSSSSEFGDRQEPYNADGWKLAALDAEEEASVPEPSLALGLMAIAASASLKRKKVA
jgi:hypothetical protein